MAPSRSRRLREWVRVDCGGLLAELLGGSHEGVELYEGRGGRGAFAEFPVRRGDRRVIHFVTSAGGSKYTVELDGAAVVSEVWLPGEAGPEITIH
jgi:hypothetical protein